MQVMHETIESIYTHDPGSHGSSDMTSLGRRAPGRPERNAGCTVIVPC
jgi:hypothetical protein